MCKRTELIGVLIILILASINSAMALCQNQLALPIMGRIECEPISSQTQLSHSIPISGTIISCGDNENTPSCDGGLAVKCSGDRLRIQLNQDIGTTNWVYMDLTPNSYRQILSFFARGDQMFLQCGYFNFLFGDVWGQTGGDAKTIYTPYGLNIYEDGAKFLYNVQSCDIADLNLQTRQNICKVVGPTGYCEQPNYYGTTLPFNTWINYVSKWVAGIPELSLHTYNGQQVYCQGDGNIYSLGEIQLESGCYNFPLEVIAQVDCCPSQQTANAYCGSDFIWHPIITEECNNEQTCPQGYVCTNGRCVTQNQPCISDLECYGNGIPICDYTNPYYDTMVQFKCINNFCQLVNEQSVTCCPPNYGCESGYFCDTQTYTCKVQVGPDLICGDKVCTAPFEDYLSCPSDCTPPMLTASQTALLLSIFIGLIAGVLSLAKLSGKLKYILPPSIGLGIGYLSWWLMTNWVLALIISIAGIGVIGIATWLLGLPAIILTIKTIYDMIVK
jgi:hypothetical protein